MRQASIVGPSLDVRWLGCQAFADTWALQRDLVVAIADGRAPETLLLVEHEPVLTVGRRRDARANVHDAGTWPVFEVERGGDATYHGPGQLVAYPLLQLGPAERDLHAYLRALEEVVIRTLADFGLTGHRAHGLTGVWVGERKVASLGVAVRRWVTYHGVALNVCTALEHFQRLNPCGLSSGVMASMSSLLNEKVAVEEVIPVLVRHAGAVLGRAVAPGGVP